MSLLPASLLRDQRGAAMAEALICLPVFVALLAGVLAFHGMYAAKLEAKSRARRLAWLQADSGQCPPASCQHADCGRIEGEVRTGGLDDALRVGDGAFSLDSFLGDVGRYLLGTVTHGVGAATAAMPSLWAPKMGLQHGVTTLLCNTTTRRAEDGADVLEHACSTGLGTTEYANEVCR